MIVEDKAKHDLIFMFRYNQIYLFKFNSSETI